MPDPYERIGKAKGKITGEDAALRFPYNVGDKASGGQHFMLIRAYDFSDPAMTSGTTFRPQKKVNGENVETVPVVWTAALFIPPAALKQVYSAKYSTLDYAGSAAVAAGDKSFSSAAQQGAHKTNQEIEGLTTSGSFLATLMDPAKREAALTQIGDKAASVGAEVSAAFQKKAGAGMKLIQAATGAAPNSHQGVIYDGPGEFREHQFSWNLLPKNYNEAKQIKQIVANFKRSMLPGGTTAAGETPDSIDSAYWSFPDMFTINFYVNGEEFKRMRIFRSVLKAMTVDFAGAESQVAFHTGRGNEPVGTILNLTFQETIHVTNADIKA